MNPINRKWKIFVASFSFLVIVPGVLLQATARDGNAATGFGTGGIVTTAIGMGSWAKALVIQADGNLVAAGYALIGPPICTPVPPVPPPVECGTPSAFALARYNTDGSLDTTFGTGGIVTTAIKGFGDDAYALAIQSDGKLVAAGYSIPGIDESGSPLPGEFALVRYNTDGSLDSTFGTGGIVTTAIGLGGQGQVNSLAIQSDGKLVAAGYTVIGTPGASPPQFVLVRYNTDGSLDTTFGTGGIVTTAMGSGLARNDIASALAIQPDGKLVAAGSSYNGSNYVLALVRYHSDGSLDSTFGTGGIVLTAVIASAGSCALAIQSDGKLVAAGYRFGLVRYNPDGDLDTTFGTGGIVMATGPNNSIPKALAIQSDGKLVAAGYYISTSQVYEFGLIRYNTNGSMDTTFGAEGIVTTTIGGRNDSAEDLVIQSDGKLVAAGASANSSGQSAFALVRYNTDGSLDTVSTNITTTTTTTTTSTTTTTTTTATTTTSTTTTTTVAGTLGDVGILSVEAPDGIAAGETRKVEVVIRNFSRTPQARSLSLTLNGVPVSGSPVSVTLTNIDTVTFNVLFEKPGIATLRARLSPGDVNRANDTETLIKIIGPRP